MATPEEEAQEKRKKRTIVLLTCGAVTLVLPLLGLLYLRMNEAKAARPANSAIMFDRREEGDIKVNLIQAPAPLAEPGETSLPIPGSPTASPTGSSLDFVKGGSNDRAAAESPAAAAPPAEPPAPAAEEEAAPPRPAARSGKKAFNAPKLQGTKSFSNFKSRSNAGGPVEGDPLKNLPPGAMDDPEVKKYLNKGR